MRSSIFSGRNYESKVVPIYEAAAGRRVTNQVCYTYVWGGLVSRRPDVWTKGTMHRIETGIAGRRIRQSFEEACATDAVGRTPLRRRKLQPQAPTTRHWIEGGVIVMIK